MSAGRGGKARRHEANKLMFPSKSRDNEAPPMGIGVAIAKKTCVITVRLLSL